MFTVFHVVHYGYGYGYGILFNMGEPSALVATVLGAHPCTYVVVV